MKIGEKYVAYALFLIYLLYGLNNYFFERTLFFNEILSLSGFVVFLAKAHVRGLTFRIPSSRIYKLVVCLLLLCAFQLLVSTVLKTNWYFYFRNSVIMYSMFTFFIGFYYYEYFVQLLRGVRRSITVFLAFALAYPMPVVLLDRFTASGFFPYLFKRSSRAAFYGVVVLNVIYAVAYSSLTVTILTLVLIVIVAVRRYIYLKLLLGIGLTGFVAGFIYLAPYLQLYKTGPYSLFGNIEQVAGRHWVLNLDGNTTWRAVLWYRLLAERFPENVLGIGMGTPLLEYQPGMTTTDSEYEDEYNAHVFGLHNTYLTLAIRLGILYLVFTLMIYDRVFREYYGFKNYYRRNNLYLFFWSFFAITGVGLFNLLLESPTVASLYWITLGFVAKVIYHRGQAARAALAPAPSAQPFYPAP